MALKICGKGEGEVAEEPDVCQPLVACEENGGSKVVLRNTHGESILLVVLSTFVVVWGSLEFGFSVGFSSPAESEIIKDLGLTLSQYSVFGSLLTIGAMVGAIMSGRVADFLGRKGALRVACVFHVVGWLAIAFAKDPLFLDIGRLSVGYGVGLISYTVPVYIAEIAPKNLRGGLTTTNQELFPPCFWQWVSSLFQSLQGGWQRLAVMQILKQHCKPFVERVVMCHVKQMKSGWLYLFF